MAIYFYKEYGSLGYLANYSNHGFYKDNIYYKTVEHYYQSKKFSDEKLQKLVIESATPKEASNIGRNRENKLRSNWKNIKRDIMLEGVLEKFRQNKEILIKLLNTGNEDIIEETIDEYYWGCGKDKTGENNFGKILVQARQILKEEIIKKFNKLKELDEIYVIGHNTIDADSYFSSYILTKILKKFNINANFAIIDNFIFSEENKQMINDYLKEKPIVLSNKEIDNKKFILVDHNDIEQSLKNYNCDIIFAIDHHIDSKKIDECYSSEYTSTLLYIYDLFKKVYDFNETDKILIALSVMTDSEYLTSTRFKETDKVLYNELKANIELEQIREKYFKTTDFSLDIVKNINSNYKLYNINGVAINRVILKGYNKERYELNNYLKKIANMYNNTLLIWNEYDTLKTLVYYNSNLVKEYDYILTSSVIIIKELLEEKIIVQNC